ncbi:helicase HerA-like domain-containing protein [Butyrivibrio sp. VCD2006]|uniref:helicase HerA-like domain-containing protein n=1 Tax=Butyrivibrio sp. VCD2006 TaxID=1280664 RepID=UPI0004290443|nr:helicase HerA-like domain-containing protein [Butyrivibrio sp. VCD2006]
MFKDGKVWAATTGNGNNLYLLPKMANRHGLIAGATGSGKTVTLKVLAESFSDMGVPVFLADVKGDLAGMIREGSGMEERIERFSLEGTGYEYKKYPATFWDLFGEKGIQLRTTVSEMGPILLSRILGLNDLQSDILTIAFKIADDNGWFLFDTKDLKALLNELSENNKDYAADYGKMSSVSISAIVRSIVALETQGADIFFGEPALNLTDWFTTDTNGKGMINILDSESLINNGVLYSTFLLWMLSELFETLPEVGDMEKPKMVFFFDEAHLLFKDTSKALLDKIEQVVKLIRSKGVGVYFITQNPRDIPDGVLAQLGNKIQHALHAYTPADQKAVKAAAESFRENPEFKTFDAIMELGTGEAVVSFLDENGTPEIAQRAFILPPMSKIGGIDDTDRENAIKGSLLYSKYANAVDSDSAYEMLQRKGVLDAEEAAKAKAEAEAEKERQKAEAAELKAKEKEEAAKIKQEEREKAKAEAAKKRAAKSVASTVSGTVGREVGKAAGKSFGKFGKTLGGNIGASLGRGIIGTLFKM